MTGTYTQVTKRNEWGSLLYFLGETRITPKCAV